jgi:hypothetical protein
MSWYAAHAIVAYRPTEPSKGKIIVYENVILLEAASDEEAEKKARKLAKASTIEGGALKFDGERTIESLMGIRKIISVSNPWPYSQEEDRPVEGTEITYSKFSVKDESTLSKLARGEEVLIRYLE